jgi:AAA domain
MATQWGRKETIIWPPHTPIYTYGAIFVALVLTSACVWCRFSFGTTPLMQAYTPTYLTSSVIAGLTATRWDKYRLLFVTDRKRATHAAMDADVVTGKTPQTDGNVLPLALSDEARQHGLTTVFRGTGQRYNDSALYAYLKNNIFAGQSLWDIYYSPFLFGALALLVQLPFSIKKDIARRKQMKYGRRLRGPELLTPKRFNRKVQGDGIGIKTDGLKEMVRIPVRAEAQHVQIIADTGAGKTNTLETIREGAERNGYAVEGFAPTSRAAGQLRDAGISADTLQSYLARGSRQQIASDPNSRHIYMLDESSLASTKQMRDFLEKIGPQDRVLLVGDTRQHQGVEAGKPFEQLQQAGMKTTRLDQIMRQKDPELLRAVEHLAKKGHKDRY